MLLQKILPQTARTTGDAIKVVLWPIAVLTVIHRLLVLAAQGSRTNDFGPVYDAARRFIDRLPVYVGDFNSVEPHYLYPPSGTLLISPIGLINYEWSRWAFISLNAVAVILAGYILLRLFGFGLKSPAAPVLLFAMFATETVSNTLVFSNINGLILLLEVLFIALLLANKQLWAGVPMGLAIAIKPTLAPLLLLPLLNKQWRPFVGSISIPVVLTALAWPMAVDPMDFVRRTMPYLSETRDYFNSALSGVGLYYGVNSVVVLILRLALAALVLVSLYLLFRYYRHDQLFFLCTGAGLLLTASFLLTSLGQQYYSMLLFPLLMTVVQQNSLIRNWPAWVAGYLFLSFDSWYSTRFSLSGDTFQILRGTVGWSLLIIVMATVLINRYLVARAQGRLADGIDPMPNAEDRTTVEA